MQIQLSCPRSFDRSWFCGVNFHFFDAKFRLNPKSMHYVTLAMPRVVPFMETKDGVDDWTEMLLLPLRTAKAPMNKCFENIKRLPHQVSPARSTFYDKFTCHKCKDTCEISILKSKLNYATSQNAKDVLKFQNKGNLTRLITQRNINVFREQEQFYINLHFM